MTPLERFRQEVTDVEIERWQQVFNQVRVGHEILKMETWIEANPKKANERRNWKRFVVNWLCKNQRDMEAIDQREITRHEIQRAIARNY